MTNDLKILVINGPNINVLEKRNPHIYGNQTYQDLIDFINNFCEKKSELSSYKVQCDFYQSNHEGDIVDALQAATGLIDNDNKVYDCIVLNAAAYTHYSIAIRDAIEAASIPIAEVHLSNINNREDFRKNSLIKDVCDFSFVGYGFESYTKAIDKMCETLGR